MASASPWASAPRILVFEDDLENARKLLIGLEELERQTVPSDQDEEESDDDADEQTICLACGQAIPPDEPQCAACGWSWLK